MRGRILQGGPPEMRRGAGGCRTDGTANSTAAVPNVSLVLRERERERERGVHMCVNGRYIKYTANKKRAYI